MSADQSEIWELFRTDGVGEWRGVGLFGSILEVARSIREIEKNVGSTLILQLTVEMGRSEDAAHIEFKGRYGSYFACAPGRYPD